MHCYNFEAKSFMLLSKLCPEPKSIQAYDKHASTKASRSLKKPNGSVFLVILAPSRSQNQAPQPVDLIIATN